MNTDLDWILQDLDRHGYDLKLSENGKYRQGKEIISIEKNQALYFGVFNEYNKNGVINIVIEILDTYHTKDYSFRVHLRVPGVFRVVNPWRALKGKDAQPILDSIKELNMEMRRELIEIDCI